MLESVQKGVLGCMGTKKTEEEEVATSHKYLVTQID